MTQQSKTLIMAAQTYERIYRIAFIIATLGVLGFIIDFGFKQSDVVQRNLNAYYFFVLLTGIATTALRYIAHNKNIRQKVFLFDMVTIFLTIVLVASHLISKKTQLYDNYFYNDNWIRLATLITFIREFSERRLELKRTFFNPAQLFIISFFALIIFGAVLLKLPNATNGGISFVDALFTSTSAVCVTGLAVVDTGTHFTLLGQLILMGLIQVGGLGILTFASYFSYFFKGGTSYENQLVLSDMTSSDKMGQVYSLLKSILLITFTIELVSAILIWMFTEKLHFGSFFEHTFFSVFHAISAFCNAGFSTLPNSLYQEGFKYNYPLQLVIAFTFILGGLGFPIVSNIMTFLKYKISLPFKKSKGVKPYRPWVLTLNSRITLVTTSLLTLFGFVFFFINEYGNTLAEHSFFGKTVVAFFGAATPRTAGFNSVDMSALKFSTLMVTIFLMWVGASPVSTGGGIKTSTFAVAVLNVMSLARGKSRIEVFRREISQVSVRRAFAVICLSLFAIVLAMMVMSIFDADKGLMKIAFECFSAYSTVGLSIGITASLSLTSKMALICLMFVGRVSMLSIVIALLRKTKAKNYRYPTEEISIN